MKKPSLKPLSERQHYDRYADTYPHVQTPAGPLKATYPLLLFVGGEESPCRLGARARYVILN